MRKVGLLTDLLHEHSSRLLPKMYEVADGVWCLVGNGLSNQTFIRGPEGVIAIDTGESVEEMQCAATITDCLPGTNSCRCLHTFSLRKWNDCDHRNRACESNMGPRTH